MGKRERNDVVNSLYSIRTKIMLVSIMIALGTTLVSLIISYYAEVDVVHRTTEKYVTQYTTFADEAFNSMLAEARTISLSLAVEKDILQLDDELLNSEASYSYYQRRMRISSFLAGLMSQKDYIDNIIVVTQNSRIYQAKTQLYMNRDLKEPLMQKALNAEKAETIFDREQEMVYYCRPIISAGQKFAVCIIELNYAILVNAYELQPLENMIIFIYDSAGELFYTNENNIDSADVILAQAENMEGKSGYFDWQGQRQYLIRHSGSSVGMTTICMIPKALLLKDVQNVKRNFLLTGIAAILCAVGVSVYLSKRLCTNIYQLTESMRKVQSGNLSVNSDIRSRDEIGLLSVSFNEMLERIRGLLEAVKRKEKMKWEAEQDVLATQIEPHFLYNSIDSIRYVAHMREEREIEAVAMALSELLRSVLSDRNKYITLWEEREYIENYIAIERFKDRGDFQLIWEVDECLWVWKIPKLLLQPIVENAVIHGISSRENGGIIHIKAYQQNQDVIIEIRDNGCGMSIEQIEQLLEEVVRRDKAGFRRVGFANVMNRIRLIYGEEYGGTIYSCEGMYTCVELRLPAGGNEDGTFSLGCG